jgi:hypothetical protein
MNRISVYKPAWQYATDSVEDAWLLMYGRYEADREFRRSRLRALSRSIAAVLGSRASRTEAWAWAEEVHPADIVGVVDGAGRLRRGVPGLPRDLRETWARAFGALHDIGELPVLCGPDGYYLDGGSGSLLRLELARARGAHAVRVQCTAEAGSGDGEECFECCEDARCVCEPSAT